VKERTLFIIVFLSITALTAIFVLGANVGVFGESVRTGDFAKWSWTAIIAEIVGATIIAFKWMLSPIEINVSLDFSPVEPFDVNLDADNCTYQVREEGRVTSEGKIAVALVNGGWQCTLPSTIKPKNVVTLKLAETNGAKWEVQSFFPFDITKRPVKRGV
jgi:hypothetical protein